MTEAIGSPGEDHDKLGRSVIDPQNLQDQGKSGMGQTVQIPSGAQIVITSLPQQGGGAAETTSNDKDKSTGKSNGNGPATPERKQEGTPDASTAASPRSVWNALEASGKDPQAYVRDIQTAFSSTPKVKPQWVDRYMKIMVVGESGMGKTTFIKNLFAAYAQDPDLKVNDASPPTSRETFTTNPDKLCTEIVVADESHLQRFHYLVQDTPGWDNMEDNMEPVLDYIKACSRACLEYEQDVSRGAPLTKFEDPRVDVCIYFIPPHRIKPVDVKFMQELAELVPVIPILAKADSMTGPELEDFRHIVRSKLIKAGKETGNDLLLRFSKDALGEAGAEHDVPPFAVVASRTMDNSVGSFWPVRVYPWGRCEALSSQHSDLAALKKLLFEVSYEELKARTEQRYYEYRERALSGEGEHDDDGRPVYRMTKHQKTKSRPLLRLAGYAVGASIIYFAGALLFGGEKRVRAEAAKVKDAVLEKAADVKDAVLEKAGDVKDVVVEKAVDVKDVVVEKAIVAKDVIVDKAGDAKDVIADKAGDAKDVIADKAGTAKDVVGKKAWNAREVVADKAGDAADAVKGKAADAKAAITGKSAEAAAKAEEEARRARHAAEREHHRGLRFPELRPWKWGRRD